MCYVCLFLGPLRQLQQERLQAAQIKLQRRVLFLVGAARLLKFAIRFGPALLSIKNYAAPKRVALCDALGSGFGGKPKRFVNFKLVMRVESAHKIHRTRDNCFADSIESCRVHQGPGSVETVQGTEPSS